VLLAHLTDTHVVGPSNEEHLYVDNNGRLATAVNALNAEDPRPDVVVATGDLANWGSADEYEMLARLMNGLRLPVLALPGNHDHRERLRSTFPSTPWADAAHASWATTVEGVRLIGLDTTIPGKPGAEFDEERSRWLANELDQVDGPCVLAMHHPPFLSGIRWMDDAGFLGLERLSALLEEKDRNGHGVCRIICGHLHRPISSTVAGIPAQVGLSTVQHVGLDLSPDAGVTLVNDPAGYLLHWLSDGRWVTHTRYIDTGEAPYVPHWAADPHATSPEV
jgi:3',5'-cyclic-AMP phosphodiesterase